MTQPTENTKRVLIVEDDPVIRENIVDMLEDEQFEVDAAESQAKAMELIEARLPNLALLDITLSDTQEGGFALCSALRARSQTIPIVFLTSHANEVDRISALRLGADDYLTKDVSLDFVLARVHALFQRMDALTTAVSQALKRRGALEIDDERLTAYWKGERVELTLTQFWMLRALASNSRKVWTPEELMQAAKTSVEPNTVVAHVTQIRRKFQTLDGDFASIRTERGAGYRWVP